MRTYNLVAAAALLAGLFQDAVADRFCFPSQCGFMDHREQVLASLAEVDPTVDGVVVGRIEAVHTRSGSEEPGTKEWRVIGMKVLVEESLAGCFEVGERKEVVLIGHGGWHWQEASAEEMAPLRAIAEANFDLERELAERDSLVFFEEEVPAQLERNRLRLIAVSVERKLPFLVLPLHLGGLDAPRRKTDAVVFPGESYLMFIPDLGETFVGQSRANSSALAFDIYPAAFATLLPRASRPEDCESAQERAGREFTW